MKTILLPGYSPSNKDWADETKAKMSRKVDVIEWDHWQGGKSFSMKKEIEKIQNKVGDQKVNIIAKSVGTRVVMHLVTTTNIRVNKVILCGIPTKLKSPTTRLLFLKGLTKLNPKKVVIIQNDNDPFAGYEIVSKFIESTANNIKVIKGPRNDHNYPYSGVFEEILN